MQRIRITSVEEIDFTNPKVVASLAKAYAVILQDKEHATKCKKDSYNK